jgi:LmbE family N-acetylglucosaminyl deacetylase
MRALLDGLGRAPRVLLLGAHSDDIEIGCGGTVLSLAERYPDATVDWVVFSAVGSRADEARASAADFCGPLDRHVELCAFPENVFPWHGPDLKAQLEVVRRRGRPDIVFTHWRGDAHQDHRTIGELTLNTFRDQLVLEYEIPKFDGDLGRPSVYSVLRADTVDRKVALLMEHFATQQARPWFEPELFRSLLRLRGVECVADSGYAEAFHPRKLRLL